MFGRNLLLLLLLLFLFLGLAFSQAISLEEMSDQSLLLSMSLELQNMRQQQSEQIKLLQTLDLILATSNNNWTREQLLIEIGKILTEKELNLTSSGKYLTMQELQKYQDIEKLYNSLITQRETEAIAYQNLNSIISKLVEEYEALEKKVKFWRTTTYIGIGAIIIEGVILYVQANN